MGNWTSQRERDTETGAEQTPAVASSNAGTSSSGSNYQVFLSFRGLDTRKGFTNALYHRLNDAGICVFLDDEELSAGEKIGSSLEQAINNSKIYIPIFSQGYASSQWCLRELKQIVEITINSDGNKEILPIFLDVETDDVKLKTPLYRNAIQRLKHEKKLSNKQVNEWSNALMKVCEFKGWVAEKYEGCGELTKVVADEVVKRLKTKHRLMPQHFVKIDDQVSTVTQKLQIGFGDVWFVRIHGMGGIGKTTLAKIVFNEISSHFGKYCCFLEDVRGNSSGIDQLVELQKKLLSEIGADAGSGTINEVDAGMDRIEQALSNKKVLIVLDNVDDIEQVEQLVGRGTLLPGSRIVITTRNKKNWQTKYPIIEYEMELMGDDLALELFSKHAFNQNSPKYEYSHLSKEIVTATGRLPLTLQVIGSHLYCKNQHIWNETLMRLNKIPFKNVFERLKISYDDLDLEVKNIFLDIACFFVGEDKKSAIYVWEDRHFYPYTGIDVLISRSLVKIVENNKFWMHDQLRDLGREIVCREDKNPEQRSRLWDCQEIRKALRTNELKKKVEVLDIDLRKNYPEFIIRSEEIERFQSLKYLKLNGGVLMGNLANSLTNLSWILWSHPHLTSNPTSMHLENVVVLQFSENGFIDDSKLQSLIAMATQLKVLSLKGCDKMTRTPYFSECSKLESLTVDHCSSLKEINSSIGKLISLIDIKIAYCPCLEFLPKEIGDLGKLKHFTVQRCDGVKRLPESIWKLKSLREVHFSTALDFYSANS